MKKSRQECLEKQNKLLERREKVEQQLLRIPGVVCVGVGLKEVKDKLSDNICFRIYVKKKKPESELAQEHVIPKTINGIETDILVNHEIVPLTIDSSKYRPLLGGIQIENERGAKGTLGCIVTINEGPNEGKPAILSCHHVLYGYGVDPEKPGKIGQPSYSPCIFSSFNEIGIIEDGEKSDSLDCAIAIISTNEGFTNEILDIGWIAGKDVAVNGMTVFKRGAKTGYKESTVKDVSYRGQIMIHSYLGNEFATYGDSGSVVVNEELKVVGLIYGGFGFDVLANHINAVIERLHITINQTGTANSLPLQTSVVPVVEDNSSPAVVLRNIENELKEIPEGKSILKLIYQHQQEVRELINTNREVKVKLKKVKS